MLKTILAIETSAPVCSVCLLHNNVIYEQFQPAQREQSQLILPMVDTVLQQAKIKLPQVNAIALSIGPGSFTGIRLGLSVVQGLCISTEIPVVPISSLQAMAQGILQSFGHKKVIVCVNAYMEEIFFARFETNAEGIMQLQGQEQLIIPEAIVMPADLGEWVGVGNGWLVYREKLPNKVYNDYLPHATNLLNLAQANAKTGTLLSIAEVSAVYLRTANAWRRIDS